LHLLFTFVGPKLRPRDPALQERMQAIAPGISASSTMWDFWLGFNVSHSLGVMLFGLVYGYLALNFPALLFASHVLSLLGLLSLMAYAATAWRYWFRAPLTGVLIALALYASGLVLAWAR
jgi:hypothetical protein